MARRFLSLALGVALLGSIASSCDPNRVYDEYQKVPSLMWKGDAPLTFDIDVEDTTARYNLVLGLRHSPMYPYSNVHLRVETRSPKGVTSSNPIEVRLAEDDGRWLGKGLGDIYDLPVPLANGMRLNERGKYQIKITQLMRQDPLPGIIDVGVRLERAAK